MASAVSVSPTLNLGACHLPSWSIGRDTPSRVTVKWFDKPSQTSRWRRITKFRADVAERIGLGFELPKAETVEVVPSAPNSQETEVVLSVW